MQPPDTDNQPPAAPGLRPLEEIPDDTSRTEPNSVSTSFEAGTDRRIKRGVLAAGCVLVVGFIVVSVVHFFEARAVARRNDAAYSMAPPVDVVVAHPPATAQELVLPGETAAWFDTTIFARVNGYVGTWLVDIGDHVKKGQLLATIETPELDAELSAAKAELQAARARVEASQAETAFAKTTNERWRDSPKGVVSDQERESKKADYQTSEARLYAAQAQVALDQSRVNQYTALTEFKRVTAPFDGTITERKIDIGNLVTAGSSSTTTLLYRMSQTDPLRVFVDVPQSASGELMQAGVPAEIRAAGAVGDVFRGKIARSAESIDAQARTMRVEVDMPNSDHRLVPGMYVNVAFTLQLRGSVEVPAAALVFRAAGTQVARVGTGNKVEFVPVTIARDNGRMVELASGVKPGDRLVLNISSQVSAGQVVAPDQPASAPPADALAAKR